MEIGHNQNSLIKKLGNINQLGYNLPYFKVQIRLL